MHLKFKKDHLCLWQISTLSGEASTFTIVIFCLPSQREEFASTGTLGTNSFESKFLLRVDQILAGPHTCTCKY